jgi:hypothetical protein
MIRSQSKTQKKLDTLPAIRPLPAQSLNFLTTPPLPAIVAQKQ